ncbi:Uncharacterised protein [Lysinibacillus sphaericus]|nr:Uncharacterised protein [Lysinibacillus sphaericus]
MGFFNMNNTKEPLHCEVCSNLEIEEDTVDQEMMKGSIDLLILSLIAERDMYGDEMV